MSGLWIEINPTQTSAPGDLRQDVAWQAIFACQICVLPFNRWVELKWGMNASALMDEMLDRQRLFLESQYSIDTTVNMERVDQRTLALRIITIPGQGLQIGLLGKVCASTPAKAEELAVKYLRELQSLIPYDYKIQAVSTSADFQRIAGTNILMEPVETTAISEIRRGNIVLPVRQGYQEVPGIWQSGARAHEQVWRAMASQETPAILNISLRSTPIFDYEKQAFWNIKNSLATLDNPPGHFMPFQAYPTWLDAYFKRRLSPLRKFFILQVHLVQTCEYDEGLARSIGSVMTRDTPEFASSGYIRVAPETAADDAAWRSYVHQLEIIPSADRLTHLSDLDEVFAVFRLPHHTPPAGLPGVTFMCPNENS